MKKQILIILIACATCSHAIGQLALDKQNILKAVKAVDVTHNCGQALMYLKLVSDSGKTSPEYLLTAARANDCSANNDQAIYYYGKFLEKNPGNDSVKKRISELKDPKSGKVAAEERNAKEFYKDVKSGRHQPCINENDFVWGLAADIFTGGASAPYKQAYSFFNLRQYPFAKKHLLFNFSAGIGYMTSGNKSWYGHVFDTTANDVSKVPGTIQVNIELSLDAVVINKHKFAISAGPLAGVTSFLMPDIYRTSEGTNEYTHPIMFSPVSGLRATLYVGKHFYSSIAYVIAFKSTYSNDLSSGTTVTGLSDNSLRISIGLRGYGEPNYYYY